MKLLAFVKKGGSAFRSSPERRTMTPKHSDIKKGGIYKQINVACFIFSINPLRFVQYIFLLLFYPSRFLCFFLMLLYLFGYFYSINCFLQNIHKMILNISFLRIYSKNICEISQATKNSYIFTQKKHQISGTFL